jgi:hypothetical protein
VIALHIGCDRVTNANKIDMPTWALIGMMRLDRVRESEEQTLNASEFTKLQGVAMSFGSMIDYLSNLEARAPKAQKVWSAEAARYASNNNPAQAKRMKACISTTTVLRKDAKKVKAELNAFIKSTKDKPKVAQYMTAKDYCAKLAPKYLASSRKLEGDFMKFTLAVYNVMDGGGPKLHPAMSDAEVRAFMTALDSFNQTFTLVRTEIARL